MCDINYKMFSAETIYTNTRQTWGADEPPLGSSGAGNQISRMIHTFSTIVLQTTLLGYLSLLSEEDEGYTHPNNENREFIFQLKPAATNEVFPGTGRPPRMDPPGKNIS